VAFADRQRLTEQNQRLREDLLLANAKLNRMGAVAVQNERLKQLLDTQHSLELNVQLAHVIGVDLGAYRYQLTLNVGARDGVKPGQPVIDAHGVMGQIKEVLPTTSVVMLITDPSHAIPVVIARSGLRTVAYGSRESGQLSCRIFRWRPMCASAITADFRTGWTFSTPGFRSASALGGTVFHRHVPGWRRPIRRRTSIAAKTCCCCTIRPSRMARPRP
jgi:rod shape-determining protein MreC